MKEINHEKKFVLFALILFTVGAFAQTEQGKIRIGGSFEFGFYNAYYDWISLNTFFIDAHGGYFIVDNLSLEVGLLSGYSYYWKQHFIQAGGGLGIRYYFPIRLFIGSKSNFIYMYDSVFDNYTYYDVNFMVGYAWFLSENVAFEPIINYRLEFVDDMNRRDRNLNARIGISIHF